MLLYTYILRNITYKSREIKSKVVTHQVSLLINLNSLNRQLHSLKIQYAVIIASLFLDNFLDSNYIRI